jgi:curved DNA-binding protein CbpA
VRIPLDYYRILGTPIQADGQQLSQAYHDRALQLPRREYSDLAINTRKQLLDEAYAVLANEEERSQYDARFLNTPYPEGNQTASPPSLDLDAEQLIGALLLLHELGEYELVLQLAEPLIDPHAKLPPDQAKLVNNRLSRADIVLTIALACLELGREQWQQGHSDQAAQTTHYGQDILLREGLFPNIRGEIQADLYKLRPYRILELLTQNPEDHDARQRGLQVLGEMLDDRGGIDGSGDDQSGLSLDDFLRFIQQLRNYLTTAEQQDLFEAEARRPSAVAMYLAVYALLARGFAYGQPHYITQAQDWLARLGRRQDVYLEQAVCALLLGQTEAANRALELSQDYEPLAFIREQSQDAPDLLPGLCLYGERWLQTEVFPHFQDLSDRTVALKDYFANDQVQAYLEEMPSEPSSADSENQWTAVESQLAATESATTAADFASSAAAAYATATAAATNPDIPAAPRPAAPPPPRDPAAKPAADVPVARRSHRSPRRGNLNTGRLIAVGAGGVFAIALFGFLVNQLWQLVFNRPADVIEAPAPETSPVPPPEPVAPPPAETTPAAIPAAETPLDLATGEDIIQTWLNVKAIAFSADHDTTELSLILAEPILTQWQRLAQDFENRNIYREYEHTVEVETVNTDDTNPDQAVIEASVREVATEYQNGTPNEEASYDDNLRVRYTVNRESGQWLIQSMDVLP